jgi:biopolymer transport protein ExbB/TolQ
LLLVTWNWPAFAAPSVLNLGLTEVSAPLGLVMLAFTVLISGLLVVYILFQQAGTLLETRRFVKEGKLQRELADKAEASRITELRAMLESELGKIDARAAESTRALVARLAQTEQQLEAKLAEATRSTAAGLGEVEDKLDRVLGRPPA